MKFFNKNIVFYVIILFLLVFFFKKTRVYEKIRLVTLNYISEDWHSQEYLQHKFKLYVPHDYKNNKIPLIIYLHGAGVNGNDNISQMRGLEYLGFSYKSSDILVNTTEKNKCFIYVPQCPAGTEWEGDILDVVSNTIEYLASKYPIDINRIYLMGYSMGGSGTFDLALNYTQKTQKYFAAIVRLSGQHYVSNEAYANVLNSAVWVHIGSHDLSVRVERAKEAFSYFHRYSQGSVLKNEKFSLQKESGYTQSLYIKGKDRFKLSVYTNLGHNISTVPFYDLNVFEWLFQQRLK